MVELALYHPEHGFYASGGRAGRRGDFLTSPEIGPLFGVLVAEAIDREWERCGSPPRFTVIDAGAGPGTLARSVLAASPRCSAALELVAVERADAQRRLHPDGVRSAAVMPGPVEAGVVVANELLDNLPFQPLVRVEGAWRAVLVDVVDGELVERIGDDVCDDPVTGESEIERYVDQQEAAAWLEAAMAGLGRGAVFVIDYGRRPGNPAEVRTYRHHGRGRDPLIGLGHQDITVEVDFEQLARRVRPPDVCSSQADWLTRLGIDALVQEGRTLWSSGAATGGLEALRGRSRVREADALCDSEGLGAFTVAHWVVD